MPRAPHDPFAALPAIAATQDPAARFAAIDQAFAQGVGHRLFTVLVVNWDQGENQRCYTSNPAAYPVGGAKPITPGSLDAMATGQCRFLDTYADIAALFPDHALIRSLGCESCVNIPVRWQGRMIGMLNLLHQARWYQPAHIPEFAVMAALAVPALQQVIAAWAAPPASG